MPYHSPINDRSPEPNNRQLIIVLGFFVLAITGLIITLFLIVNQLINLIPIELEEKLGSVITSQLNIEKTASIEQHNLNILLDNLEKSLPNKTTAKRDYQILYLPEKTVNALAIPGNKIIIYQGLLSKMDSENELVMVIGHEIGHFANRDHLKRFGNFVLMQILLSFFLGDGNLLQSGADFSNLIINSQYSQNQEIKADQFGLELLNKYYGHVAGATDFFQKLQQENNNQIDFLASHPLPRRRIKKLTRLIKQNKYTLGTKTALNLTEK